MTGSRPSLSPVLPPVLLSLVLLMLLQRLLQRSSSELIQEEALKKREAIRRPQVPFPVKFSRDSTKRNQQNVTAIIHPLMKPRYLYTDSLGRMYRRHVSYIPRLGDDKLIRSDRFPQPQREFDAAAGFPSSLGQDRTRNGQLTLGEEGL